MPQAYVPFPRAAHDGAFPESAPIDEQLRFMLNYAVLAPSVMNSQPWRFRVAGSEVFLYADRSRALPALDPDSRELVISCGAALLNLRLAVRHYGYSVSFEAVDDPGQPDLIAALSAGKPTPATRDEEALFAAIPRRHTERRPFAEMEVPRGMLRDLEQDASAEGARLHVFAGAGEKAELGALVGDAMRRLAGNAGAKADVAAWLRPDGDPRPDGVRDSRQNEWAWRSDSRIPVEPVAVGMTALAAGSPAILLLSTRSDDARSWLDSGQALERVLLRATMHDLAASYLNQVTEEPATRMKLMEKTDGAYPQVMFRVGHPIPRGGTQRRRVTEVIDAGA